MYSRARLLGNMCSLIFKVSGFVQTLTGCEDQARLFKDEVSEAGTRAEWGQRKVTHRDGRKQLSSPVPPSDGHGPLSSPLGESRQSDRTSGESLVWTAAPLGSPCGQTTPRKGEAPRRPDSIHRPALCPILCFPGLPPVSPSKGISNGTGTAISCKGPTCTSGPDPEAPQR